MRENVARTIARYQMLPPKAAVLVALSGGADSVALLCVLRELGYAVRAYHLNHCLRGAESDRDEAFVRELCGTLGVPLVIERRDAAAFAAAHKQSIETGARTLRYARLTDAAQGGLIATAHNADDNVETVLFHLLRGTGGRGLAGIPPVRGSIVRPLLETSRAQIEQYLKARGQTFVTDSTNFLTDVSRNRLRHEVMPVLRQMNPALTEAVGRLSHLLRQDEAELTAQAKRAAAQARVGERYKIDALRALPDALRTRALRALVLEQGVPAGALGQTQTDAVDALLNKPSAGTLHLPGGVSVYRETGMLWCEKTPKPWCEPLQVPLEGCVGPYHTRISVNFSEKNLDIHNSFNTFFVNCGKIDFESLIARSPLPGDRMQIAESSGERTLKKLMQDRRIALHERAKRTVIADKSGIIGVQSVGADARRISHKSRAMIIQFEGTRA